VPIVDTAPVTLPADPPPAAPAPPAPLALAARRVLARDGVDYVLRPWQAGHLVALAEERDPGPVPLACGLGIGWLQARLDEALAELAGR
jgi:hypothetical protein